MLRSLELSILLLGAGCTMVASHSVDRFFHEHYVFTKGDAWMLRGPYTESKVISPTTVILSERDERIALTLRGPLSTADEELDSKCMGILSAISLRDAYLRIDSTCVTPDGGMKGVVYTPANRVWTGWDATGALQYENLTYVMPQLLMITQGYCLVDHSDTDYPLYPVFRDAEQLARKAHRGYWTDRAHRERIEDNP